jgi:hypothetical protein
VVINGRIKADKPGQRSDIDTDVARGALLDMDIRELLTKK